MTTSDDHRRANPRAPLAVAVCAPRRGRHRLALRRRTARLVHGSVGGGPVQRQRQLPAFGRGVDASHRAPGGFPGADGSPGDHQRRGRPERRDAAAAVSDLEAIASLQVVGQVSPPIPSEDGQALQAIVPSIRISARDLSTSSRRSGTARGHARRRGIRRGTGRHPCGLRRCLRWDRRHPARHCRCGGTCHPAHRLSQPRAAFPRAPERAARSGCRLSSGLLPRR